MTTTNAFARGVSALLNRMVERDLILLVNPVAIDGDRVWWRSPTPLEKFVDFADYATIRTYSRWVTSNEYTALLPDGSLLQLHYTLREGVIQKHRLAFVPCPYRIPEDLLQTDGIIDILDLFADTPHEEITAQTIVRVDYDPAAASDGHPAAHITLNVASCRIACEAPMTPEDFVGFIFRSFYVDLWRDNRSFFDGFKRSSMPGTLQDSERLSPHLAWRREIAT